jgi:hypothetical protein
MMKLLTSRRALALYFAGMTCLHVVVIWNAAELIQKGYPDFTHMYAAGKIVRLGLGHQLYDDATQYRVQQQFASGVSIRQGALPYNHPPYEALLFLPLTYLPYLAAFVVWDLLAFAILAFLPYLLKPHIPLLQSSPAAYWMLASLGFYPISVAFLQGQDVMLLLLLICLSYVALKTNRDLAAGAYLALGLFRFHLLLPFFVMMMVQRRRSVYAFVSVAAILVAISVAMVGGWQGALSYPKYAWNAERSMGRGAIVPADMPNLRGFLYTQISPHLSKSNIDILFLVISVALLAMAISTWRSRCKHNLDLAFSLAIILSVFDSYHAFAYDLALYLLAIALVLNHLHQRDTEKRRKLLLVAPITIFYCSPILMILWLHYGQLNLLAPVMFAWFWGVNYLPSTVHSERSNPTNVSASH